MSMLDCIIFMFVGVILGVSGVLHYISNKEVTPFEGYIEMACIKIGSDLKSYTMGGELTCENGARFSYEVKKPL